MSQRGIARKKKIKNSLNPAFISFFSLPEFVHHQKGVVGNGVVVGNDLAVGSENNAGNFFFKTGLMAGLPPPKKFYVPFHKN